MSEKKYQAKLDLRIDWSELDLFGHVNNVSFFKYIQASRLHYWEQVGISQLYPKHKIGPMLASSRCEFKRPLYYPGNIRIYSRIDFIKNSSFGICHAIYNQDDKLAAAAFDTLVLFDFNSETKVEIPQEIRGNIEGLELQRP
mgnify:CR=1 FL=1